MVFSSDEAAASPDPVKSSFPLFKIYLLDVCVFVLFVINTKRCISLLFICTLNVLGVETFICSPRSADKSEFVQRQFRLYSTNSEIVTSEDPKPQAHMTWVCYTVRVRARAISGPTFIFSSAQ